MWRDAPTGDCWTALSAAIHYREARQEHRWHGYAVTFWLQVGLQVIQSNRLRMFLHCPRSSGGGRGREMADKMSEEQVDLQISLM